VPHQQFANNIEEGSPLVLVDRTLVAHLLERRGSQGHSGEGEAGHMQ
jgi:hypothetical protein